MSAERVFPGLVVTFQAYDEDVFQKFLGVLQDCDEVDLEKSKKVELEYDYGRTSFLIMFTEAIDVLPLRQMLHQRLPNVFTPPL